jgi:hypothetical protein
MGNYSPNITWSFPRRLESFHCCLQIDLWPCCSFVSLPSSFKFHCPKFWSCRRVQVACGALSLSLHVNYAAEPDQRLCITNILLQWSGIELPILLFLCAFHLWS